MEALVPVRGVPSLTGWTEDSGLLVEEVVASVFRRSLISTDHQ